MSCNYEYKDCEFSSSDDQLMIYHAVLTSIIEHQSHHSYLGGKEKGVIERYDYKSPDSVKMNREFAKLQNELFNDTAKFCTLYLDTAAEQPRFAPWRYYQTTRNKDDIILKELIEGFTSEGQSAVDNLNTIQKKYSPSDFKLCTAKLEYFDAYETIKDECGIGKIQLSKVFLSGDRGRGLMYYHFNCGELCGHYALIVVEKSGDKWTIKNYERFKVY